MRLIDSYLSLIDSCITQLKAQGLSETHNESKEKEFLGRRAGARGREAGIEGSESSVGDDQETDRKSSTLLLNFERVPPTVFPVLLPFE